MRGRFLVCEGTDGSGKATQAKLLVARLHNEGILVKYLDFPQYNEFHGKVIGQALHGELGGLEALHPKLISYPYAVDRQSRAQEIEKGLKNGVWFISSRYSLSNATHQTARMPKEEREEFLQWWEELEYVQLGIAREDHNYFLYVPSDIGQALVDKKGERDYMAGSGKDLLENDTQHQENAAQMYFQLAEKWPHSITRINCCDAEGLLMSRETIHEMVWQKTLELYGEEIREGKIRQERGRI